MSHCGLINTDKLEVVHHSNCASRMFWKPDAMAAACNCQQIQLAEQAHRNSQILAVIEMIFEHENETNLNERQNIRETIDRILKST